jgi:small subunit ribosomal protein S11
MGKKRIITKVETELSQEASSAPGAPSAGPKETRRGIQRGIAHILATYNNTVIAISDERGNIIAWSSAGSMGFKGTKKATPYAAARAAEAVAEKAKRAGIESVSVMVKGIGSGRESAIRSLANYGLEITMIKDATPIPHNGPRPKKVRRV